MSPWCIAVQALVHHRLSSALTGPEWQLLVMPVHVQCTLYIHVLYRLVISWSLVQRSSFVLQVTQFPPSPKLRWPLSGQCSGETWAPFWKFNVMILLSVDRDDQGNPDHHYKIIWPNTNVCKNVICDAIWHPWTKHWRNLKSAQRQTLLLLLNSLCQCIPLYIQEVVDCW